MNNEIALEKAVAAVSSAFAKLPANADETALAGVFRQGPMGIIRASDGTIVGAHDGVFAHWAHTIESAREVHRIAEDLLAGKDPRAWAKPPRSAICAATGVDAGVRWTTGYRVEVDGDGLVTSVEPADGWTDAELRQDAVALGDWEPTVGARPPSRVLTEIRGWRN